MAAYSHFLRETVKVQYRLGDILLSASGTFVGDSGRSIFLEERLEQRGKQSYFRWEIPYRHIHRIEVVGQEPAAEPPAASEPAQPRAAAAAASSSEATSGGNPMSLPQSRQPA